MTRRLLPLLALALATSPSTVVCAAPDDVEKHERAVRKAMTKLLQGRTLKKLTRLQKGKGKTKRYVLDRRAASKLYWRYLPAYYKQKFELARFLPLADDGLKTTLVIHKPSVTKVSVHRAAVTVEYSATSVTLERRFLPDANARQRVKLGKGFSSWDVWVRQGGKWVLARQRFDGQKHSKQPVMVKEDRRAVTGEQLRQHPWFKGRISVNAMATAFYETQAALRGPWPDDTEVARNKRRQEAVDTLSGLMKRKEVADVGWVKTVQPPPKNADPRTKLQVIIYCGFLEVYANIGEPQATDRKDFFASLKKGEPVVFRLPYKYTVKHGLIAQSRTDGKATVKRLDP